MHTLIAVRLGYFALFSLFLGEQASAIPDGTSTPEVIARLVANASKKPPGPVENDVTDQSVNTSIVLSKGFQGGPSPHEGLASEFNTFSIEGPLTSIYSEGQAAIYCGKVKLTKDALKSEQEDSVTDNPPGFGDSGGWSDFIGPRVSHDGLIIATFCLVQQHGLWKVHGVYLSNKVVTGDTKAFIVDQLSAFAKKQ